MERAAAKTGILVALLANGMLLAVKASATGVSDSLTIFSETLNSLADFLGAIILFVFVRWAHRERDEDHPFGHHRAEPIAGLMLAIFSAILGMEVLRHAILDLIDGSSPHHVGWFPLGALAVAVVVKASMYRYFSALSQKLESPAFRASAIDCRNDVLVATQAIFGVALAQFQLGVFDRISALLVGLYILYSAYRIGIENIDYLMGKSPSEAVHESIRRAADGIAEVREVDDIRAHFVGTKVHVELTTRVDAQLSTADSHDVAEEVRHAVESVPGVGRAFVHIEPHLVTETEAPTYAANA